MDKDEYLHKVLPHRMMAIDTLKVVLQYLSTITTPQPLEILLNGKTRVQGLSTAWTNPAIESGIMHCRACLEFLGLQLNSQNPTRLRERKNSRHDDIVIEDFELPRVPIEGAISCYSGNRDDAEAALSYVLFLANKGVAHNTTQIQSSNNSPDLLLIAAMGIPVLLEKHFYKPLGLPTPQYKITYSEQ
ncbi:MAG: hypothetical protein OXT49_03750 [Gammaproteobacteria bacterium]|nr:hypothetical protein [Gammaproteobacteria bacterium]